MELDDYIPLCYHDVVSIPFQDVVTDEVKLPPPRLQALIDDFRDHRRSGLIRLAYPSDKYIYLIFQRGALVNGYSVLAGSSQRADQVIDAVKVAGDAFPKVISMSGTALAMCKIALESRAGRQETVDGREVFSLVEKGRAESIEPGLLHVHWKQAEGMFLFQAMQPTGHSLILLADRVIDEDGISDYPLKQSGAQVQAVLHPIDPAVAAWKEHLLKCAFSQICNQALLRFEEITGRAIIDSFIRTLLLNISRQSVDIQINARRVQDAEVFPSPERAAEIYRSLLRILADQGSTIIGAHLSSAILSQILYLLRADESRIAREYALVPADILNEEKARVATDV